jgi:hypothetical protein
MNISLNIDGNNPLLHILGLTTHYTILLLVILFVYNAALEFRHIFLHKDYWRGHVTSLVWNPGNIWNWANLIWNILWAGVLTGSALTIAGLLFAALLCVRISL